MIEQPTQLEMTPSGRLRIVWSDGQIREYAVRELRDKCPCATCREKRSAPPPATSLPILTPQEAAPLRITAMDPVGRYAYGIHFSDGHETGIFTLESLRGWGSRSRLRAGYKAIFRRRSAATAGRGWRRRECRRAPIFRSWPCRLWRLSS